LTCGSVPILMGLGGGWCVAIDNDIIIIRCYAVAGAACDVYVLMIC
jgi:hypothetical protein